jgi:hypothetical protein
MSSKRHHPHQGGTTPTTEPKDRPGVVQFSVPEVVQFSMSLDTNFALNSFSNSGTTNAYGLSGYWQPAQAGWLPSISAGWGLNSTSYSGNIDETGLVSTSQSWSLGLQ